jgi:hypothetical protein
VSEHVSVKEALRRLIFEMARDEVIVRPVLADIARTLSLRSGRAIPPHDVTKMLWALQKEGRIKLSMSHRDGRSRSGHVTRIEVLR